VGKVKRRKASFFLDVLTAALLAVTALTAIVFSFKTNASAYASVSQNAFYEKNAVYFADLLLKNCLPDGIASCEENLVHVKEIDSRAVQEIVLNDELGFKIRDLKGRVLQTRGMLATNANASNSNSHASENANSFCVSRPAFFENQVVVLQVCLNAKSEKKNREKN